MEPSTTAERVTYGAAYYPEQRAQEEWAQDLGLMARAGMNAVRIAEFSWSRLEPRSGDYDFHWLEQFLDLAAEAGIGVVLSPPMRTAPAWLVSEEPEIMAVDSDGTRLAYGARYTFCVNHPRLRRAGCALATWLARQFGSHPAVAAWHLDNEYGADVDCHCEVCRETWTAWLTVQYASVGQLNEAWGTVFWGLEFSAFEQIPTPSRTLKERRNPGHWLAWRRFRSASTVGTVAEHAQAVRAGHPDAVITTNAQPPNHSRDFNNATDYYELYKDLDVAGTNYYPPYGDEWRRLEVALAACRSYKDDGFEIFELRNGPHAIPGRSGNSPQPGEVERLAVHALSHGANGLYFFRWNFFGRGFEQYQGSVLTAADRPGRIYDEVSRVGQRLGITASSLTDTRVISHVAVMYDPQARWLAEYEIGERGPASMYLDTVRALFSSIRNLRRNVDLVPPHGAWQRYQVLVLPMMMLMDEDLAQRLTRFVQDGGTIVCLPLTGVRDLEAGIHHGRIQTTMELLLGSTRDEYVTIPHGEVVLFRWAGRTYRGRHYADLPQLERATAAGDFEGAWFAGTPCVMENHVGGGRVMAIATFPDPDFYASFFERLFEDVALPPIRGVEAPPLVDVAERRSDRRRLVFLINGSSDVQTVHVSGDAEDVWNAAHVNGVLELVPFGVAVLDFGRA
ncbi:beta-galactosidase [Ruania alba]|uniref:Beta-galactosidase n=1 Tax=Ruania alba TaxID=648782 RepID=A0A1H5HLL1_9MICO|nr:beta-galactosidase [Ruania alba]SEE28644.1 beta-galactosidase [Ruania alba]